MSQPPNNEPVPPGPQQTIRDVNINVPVPYRLPVHVDLAIESQKKWLEMVRRGEQLYKDDADLQRKAQKGLRIKERNLPPEIVGRLYAQYCALINDMYDAYLNNVQIQRTEYIQEIISLLVKRMFELREELVHFIVNDYIFVDTSVKQLFKTPYDIQIVVPYHFATDARPGTYEATLQKMWKDAARRKRIALKPKRKVNIEIDLIDADLLKLDAEKMEPIKDKAKNTENDDDSGEEEEEEEDYDEGNDEDEPPSENKVNTLLIQKHIRFRRFYVIQYAEKYSIRCKFYAREDIVKPTVETMSLAASLIQKIYRAFMTAKRQHVLNHKRDVILGLVPDAERRPLKFREENVKLYEKRRQTREKLNARYAELIEKEKARIIFFKRDGVIDDITDEIRNWFDEWYHGYKFFPQYPYETEGGTILLVKGIYPSIEEQKEDDEIYRKATKGKNKETLREEMKQRQREAKARVEMEKIRLIKEAKDYNKSRCSPLTDFGYVVKTSLTTEPIYEALRRYRQAWSIYDRWPLERCGEVIYGFMKPLLTEKLMDDMHLECRKIVDEMMRLELKLFNKVQKSLYERYNVLWPKQRIRSRPKKVKIPKQFTANKDLIKSVQPLFDLEIITKPTSKLDDILGDLSYGAYEANITDANATFPSPGYADVKRRLVLSCIFGAGFEPTSIRKKAVMLMGLPRNGKSFLVDCVAGEMNAVKIDISPEVFSSKVEKPMKMLKMVFNAAKIFQPSVIFFKDIERAFLKAVPPQMKTLKPTLLKKPLTKLMKKFPTAEKVIFIATCSQPFLANVAPMMKIFSEVIVVPKPDYSSLQRFFYDRFQNERSMPRDYSVQGLARCMQGIGFGLIMEAYNNVMNPARICALNHTPLQQSEFIDYMIENDIESISEKDYQKMMDLWLKFSPLKTEREEYAIINKKRDVIYKKLAKIKADKAAKAAGKTPK